jgi:hypothetical protein
MSGRSPHEIVEFLVNRRFPIKARTGRLLADAGVVSAVEQLTKARNFRQELEQLPSEELHARYNSVLEEDRQEALKLEASRPFNQPYAMADFDYWAKYPYWKVDEGIALLLGRSPVALVWKDVAEYAFSSALIANFARIRELATRAVHWKELYEGNYPGSFLMWAKRKNLPVPQELEEKVAAYGHFVGDWKSLHDDLKVQTDKMIGDWRSLYEKLKAQSEKHQAEVQKRYEGLLAATRTRITDLEGQIIALKEQAQQPLGDKPLGQREADSLRKLVIGLAISGHAYDPSAQRSRVVSEIASDIAQLGIPLDEDTIRKHLRAGVELLPRALDDRPAATERK